MTQDPEMRLTAAQLVSRARELAVLPGTYFRTKKILDDPTCPMTMLQTL